MMELSRRKRRIFEIIRLFAIHAPGVGGRNGNNFRIAAAVVHRNDIVALRCNSYRTTPRLLPYYIYPHYHAEAAALLACGIDKALGADLYITRVLRNNQIALSRPCKACQVLIEKYEINNVFYSTETGYERL